jgi:hypothetical protein
MIVKDDSRRSVLTVLQREAKPELGGRVCTDLAHLLRMRARMMLQRAMRAASSSLLPYTVPTLRRIQSNFLIKIRQVYF